MHLRFWFNRYMVWNISLALLLHLTVAALSSGSEPNQITNDIFEKR